MAEMERFLPEPRHIITIQALDRDGKMKFNRTVGKVLTVATVAATVTVAGTLPVCAAGLWDVFNAKYYADQYADLKEAFGYDEEALYTHFLTFGINEGRTMSPVLNVVAYREMYGDLDEAFGDDYEAIINHYLTYGISEGRTAGVTLVTKSGETVKNTGSSSPSTPEAPAPSTPSTPETSTPSTPSGSGGSTDGTAGQDANISPSMTYDSDYITSPFFKSEVSVSSGDATVTFTVVDSNNDNAPLDLENAYWQIWEPNITSPKTTLSNEYGTVDHSGVLRGSTVTLTISQEETAEYIVIHWYVDKYGGKSLTSPKLYIKHD